MNKLTAIVSVFFLLLISCNSKPDKKPVIINLNGIQYDTLYLYHSGSHCGEWGGDRYKVKVFRQKPDKNLVAVLKVIRMKCDNGDMYDYPDSTYKEMINITEQDEGLIQDCLVELIRLQISNDSPVGHAGNGNAAWRSDSSFILRDYPSGTWTSFNRLIEKFEKR